MSSADGERDIYCHGYTHPNGGPSDVAAGGHSKARSSTPSDAASQRAGELLLIAAGVVGRRRSLGGYAELTARDVSGVVNALTAIALGEPPARGEERDTAVALAHRILDDDHPERTALWARLTRLPTATTSRPPAGLLAGREMDEGRRD